MIIELIFIEVQLGNSLVEEDYRGYVGLGRGYEI